MLALLGMKYVTRLFCGFESNAHLSRTEHYLEHPMMVCMCIYAGQYVYIHCLMVSHVYYAVYSGRQLPRFWMKVLPPPTRVQAKQPVTSQESP